MSDKCPVLSSLYDLPFQQDRTAAWHQLHEIGEVAISDKGAYVIIGADAVEAVAKNTAVFSSKANGEMMASPIPMVPIETDPPEHAPIGECLTSSSARAAWLHGQTNCELRLEN